MMSGTVYVGGKPLGRVTRLHQVEPLVDDEEAAGIAFDARLAAEVDLELNPFAPGTRRRLLWTSHYLERRLELDPVTPPAPAQ